VATFAPQGVPSTIVAIPAKNEAGRIAACLLALDRQSQRPGAVLLLVNGATDNTEAIARSMRAASPWISPRNPRGLTTSC
jgi:glycosyltransferase involved in cell wall biosynthesis